MIRVWRELVNFWIEVFWRSGRGRRVIVWKGDQKGDQDELYSEFFLRRIRVRTAFFVLLATYTILICGATGLTLYHGLIPGLDIRELRQSTMLFSMRLQALEDSIDSQTHYIANIRRLMAKDLDPSYTGILSDTTASVEPSVPIPAALSVQQEDRESQALPLFRFSIDDAPASMSSPAPINYLASLALPALPPVQGLITRGFDAQEEHYAIDIAVSEGTVVRCIGDGYVVFADWTYEGGHTIVVQHADGYVSVYKHNRRLLKRVGDRVGVRESIAVSGDSGEYTSGPHLHFELWNNGLAQDPIAYLLGY
jgi:hypothetical protein